MEVGPRKRLHASSLLIDLLLHIVVILVVVDDLVVLVVLLVLVLSLEFCLILLVVLLLLGLKLLVLLLVLLVLISRLQLLDEVGVGGRADLRRVGRQLAALRDQVRIVVLLGDLLRVLWLVVLILRAWSSGIGADVRVATESCQPRVCASVCTKRTRVRARVRRQRGTYVILCLLRLLEL